MVLALTSIPTSGGLGISRASSRIGERWVNKLLDRGLSAQIARQVEAHRDDCYMRAFQALDYLPDEAVYVEGWVVTPEGIALRSHAWCEVGGRIIDPTCDDTESPAYFGGIRYPKRRAKALYGWVGRMPLSWYAIDNVDFDNYYDALEKARRAAAHTLTALGDNGHVPSS